MYYRHKGISRKRICSSQDNEVKAVSLLPILGNGRGKPWHLCPQPCPSAVGIMGVGAPGPTHA